MSSRHIVRTLFAVLIYTISPTLAQAQVAASWSDSFVDKAGVNVHWSNTAYNNAYATLKTELGSAGFRHVRDGTVSQAFTRGTDLFNTYGIQTTFITSRKVNGVLDPTQIAAELTSIKNGMPAGGIGALEGPNEYDLAGNHGSDSNWVSTISTYQQDVFTQSRADATLQTKPVIGPSFTTEAAYDSVGDLSSYLDFTNLHAYQSWRNPGTGGWGANGFGSITWNINQLAHIQGPTKPIQSTECGYNTNPATESGMSENVQAKYTLRTMAEFYRRGITGVYKYELLDIDSSKWGVLRSALTEKPAYLATKNLLNLLADNTWNTTTKTWANVSYGGGSLGYTISGATTIHSLLLQKSNGDFYLLVWNEVASYNGDTDADIVVSSLSATLNLTTAVTAGTKYTFATDGSMSSSAAAITGSAGAQQIALSVTDAIQVIKLTPAAPTIGATADAYVFDGQPTTNFGTATPLIVKNNGSAGWNRESYLTFNTSNIAGTMSSVKLRVWANISNTNNPSIVANAYPVSAVTWSENTINWNNRPAKGTSLGSITVAGTTNAWYELDVTSYVNSERAAGRKIVSFAYAAPNVSTDLVQITSREGTNPPQLLMTPGTLVDDPNTSIVYVGGNWTADTSNPNRYNGTNHYSPGAGNTATFTFSGTSIGWMAGPGPNRGKADVYVDSVLQTTIDLYSATAIYQSIVWSKNGLASGSHTIKIYVRGDKNASSSGTYVDVDAFKID